MIVSLSQPKTSAALRVGAAVQSLVFLHRNDHDDAAPCFSISTGSARAVSIIRPKAFFASRADMVFMAESCGDPFGHLGQNSSFWQRRICGFDLGAWACFGDEISPEDKGEDEGKIKRVASLPELRS